MTSPKDFEELGLPKLTEREFQEQVIQLAQLCGWKVAWFRPVRIERADGSIYYETPVGADGAGWPDLLLVKGKCLVTAELKVRKNVPSREQWDWLRRLADAGAYACVWHPDDWPYIQELLQDGKLPCVTTLLKYPVPAAEPGSAT